jgi:hypothetical protein
MSLIPWRKLISVWTIAGVIVNVYKLQQLEIICGDYNFSEDTAD